MARRPIRCGSAALALAQNFSDGPGACAALGRLGLRDDAITDLEGHGVPPSDCC